MQVQIPTREEVLECIRQLAVLPSADFIAGQMRGEGCAGKRRDKALCPLNRWLELSFPGIWFTTDANTVSVGCNTPEPFTVALPQAAMDFVANFDAGRYPFLDLEL